jgi:putative ABC transport system permease protein
LPGAEPLDEQSHPTAVVEIVSPDYFRTLDATVSGREFTRFDRSPGDPVVIVNESFAREHWPHQNPLGQRIRLFGGVEPWRTVVGVASNIVYDPSRQEITPVIYVPYAQTARNADMWILVQSSLRASELAAPFRHEINTLDPSAIIWLGPFDLSDRLAVNGLYGDIRNHAVLLVIFGCVALIVACFGLYAVIAGSVSQRTQEIGIRIAVGARPRHILEIVLKLVMIPFVTGLTIGLAGSQAVIRILSSELVRVSSADRGSLIIACLVLATAATLACWIPARRAMRVDPVIALKR